MLLQWVVCGAFCINLVLLTLLLYFVLDIQGQEKEVEEEDEKT